MAYFAVVRHYSSVNNCFVGMRREHTAVKAPSANITESTQHILTSDAAANAESQV